MNIFSILKVDDGYSLNQYPLDNLRLDPLSVSPNRSGATTTPLYGVSVILIQIQIFLGSILNNLRAGKTLHLFASFYTCRIRFPTDTANFQTVLFRFLINIAPVRSGGAAHTKQPSLLLLSKKPHVFERR
jgi:hypothetical protein